MEKLFEHLANKEADNGFEADVAENLNRFDDAEDYLDDNFKIVEEIFKRLYEEKKFFILYSHIAKEHSRVISEKIRYIKNLYIMYAQDIIWSPPQARTADVEGVRGTIISLVDNFVKRINEDILRHDLEEFHADAERAVFVLNDVKVSLLERVNELDSLFDSFL